MPLQASASVRRRPSDGATNETSVSHATHVCALSGPQGPAGAASCASFASSIPQFAKPASQVQSVWSPPALRPCAPQARQSISAGSPLRAEGTGDSTA